MTRSRFCTTLVCSGASLLMVSAMTACRGERTDKPPRQFLPDMDDQPRFNPQSQTQFFENTRTMREPVEGTVAFGYSAVLMDTDWNQANLEKRATLLKDDSAVYFGTNEDGTPVDRIPVEVTPELLARGAERFGIYCSVCHGFGGEGATPSGGGMAGRKWSAPVPALIAEKYRHGGEKGADGFIFGVIRNGVWGADGANRMPSYSHAIDEHDAWAIVAHLRVLQNASTGTLDQLDDETRRVLEGERVEPSTDSTGAPVTPETSDSPDTTDGGAP